MSKALIVIDVQRDFCEGGSLAVSGGAEVAWQITQRLANGGFDYAVATRDHHIDPGSHFSDTPDYVHSWPAHCVVGTPGVEFHPNFDTAKIAAVFDKGEYSAAYSGFQGTSDGINLADWLHQRSVSEVDIVGIATDYCVRATALDAAQAGFATTVHLALTAGVAESSVRAALDDMRKAHVALEGEPVVNA